ncbi:alpha/beta hydrolase family protein [Clavibacter michiganensis]|uniref:alpha/beta hydrolase family protein n=2 Tax=Clavibacter michiganensis TaxID=28447 RepID=UPI00292D0EBE|nr:alpha/beta fold hydrolase [Clavibacter michiganensis]
MTALSTAAWGIGLAAGAALGAGALAADAALIRRLVLRGRTKVIPITVDVAQQSIRLPATDATRMPGEYGVWVNGARGHLRVGEVLADADDVVERRILESYGDLAGATEGRWTGHTFANAASTGLSYQDVDVPVEDGTRPAWVFRACEGRRWALHLHGIKSSRASALRSVPIAAELGMTSLVPAFYGDVDADAAPGAGDVAQGSTLGVREARDVEAAIAFAVESGAEEIVVFGWSMGATIALLLAESSRFHDRITQLVLIGPAVSWRSSIARGIAAARLPAWVGPPLFRSLEARGLSKLGRMAEPTSFERLDWLRVDRPVRVPTLVLHSAGDTDNELGESRELARLNPSTVDVYEFPAVPHLMEWNAHRELFERVVRDRLRP